MSIPADIFIHEIAPRLRFFDLYRHQTDSHYQQAYQSALTLETNRDDLWLTSILADDPSILQHLVVESKDEPMLRFIVKHQAYNVADHLVNLDIFNRATWIHALNSSYTLCHLVSDKVFRFIATSEDQPRQPDIQWICSNCPFHQQEFNRYMTKLEHMCETAQDFTHLVDQMSAQLDQYGQETSIHLLSNWRESR